MEIHSLPLQLEFDRSYSALLRAHCSAKFKPRQNKNLGDLVASVIFLHFSDSFPVDNLNSQISILSP